MQPFQLELAHEHQRDLRRRGIRRTDTRHLRRGAASTLRRLAGAIEPR